MKDLFGNDTPLPSQIPKHGHKRTFYLRRYRRSEDKKVRCKTCVHLRKKDSFSKNFYKCFLIGDSNAWTTDVRLRNVCDLWRPDISTPSQFMEWIGTIITIDPLTQLQIKENLYHLLTHYNHDKEFNTKS